MRKRIHLKKKKFLDIFIISNFFFLTLDIFYAHSINNFSHRGEWIPLIFSAFASIVLFLNLFLPKKIKQKISLSIACFSILIGTLGIYFHLESQFFQSVSFRSLIYTAPLVAPLSYTALGSLLFLNYLIPSEKIEFGQWLIVHAYIGFAGNFILSLFDHAQNGFFYSLEWIPVVSSALVLVFIPLGFVKQFYKIFKQTFKYLIWMQFFVGILGAGFHIYAILINRTFSIIDKILYGPPILAPLLFSNLAFLMAIGWICILHKNKKLISLRLSLD